MQCKTTKSNSARFLLTRTTCGCVSTRAKLNGQITSFGSREETVTRSDDCLVFEDSFREGMKWNHKVNILLEGLPLHAQSAGIAASSTRSALIGGSQRSTCSCPVLSQSICRR